MPPRSCVQLGALSPHQEGPGLVAIVMRVQDLVRVAYTTVPTENPLISGGRRCCAELSHSRFISFRGQSPLARSTIEGLTFFRSTRALQALGGHPVTQDPGQSQVQTDSGLLLFSPPAISPEAVLWHNNAQCTYHYMIPTGVHSYSYECWVNGANSATSVRSGMRCHILCARSESTFLPDSKPPLRYRIALLATNCPLSNKI